MELVFDLHHHHVYELPAMNKPRKRITLILVHVAAWLAFLSLPAIFNPRPHGEGLTRLANDLLEPARLMNGVFLVALFYTNYYLVIPTLYLKKRFVPLACSFVTSFALFGILNFFSFPAELKGNEHGFLPFFGMFHLFMFIIVYILSFAISLYEQLQSAKEQMLNTEISFLKAQINPHFLFNTLNSIYSLALIKSDAAPDAIVKLSGMMRYSVSDAGLTHVSLSKEVNYISNYIDLQKLRLTAKVKISFDVTGSTDGKQIAPFLLIPFIENAFKHGVNTEEDSDIRISLSISDEELAMRVSNNKVFMRKDLEKGERLGIETTRKRLEMLYPGNNALKVTDNEKEFVVDLKIVY